MKIRIFAVLLLAAVCFTLFTGCSAVNALQQLDRAEEVIEHRLDVAEDKLERRIEATFTEAAVPQAQAPDAAPKVDTSAAAPAQAPAQPANRLTGEEARDIALRHAGLSANDVRGLRVEFDYDDGRPEYDVDFRSGGYEYDYEIHAETGDIITWDKELDD